MPKYFCDYCDTFLTHDSPSVRKTHCAGRKHKENVRLYYETLYEEKFRKVSVPPPCPARLDVPPPCPARLDVPPPPTGPGMFGGPVMPNFIPPPSVINPNQPPPMLWLPR